jgi:hypothetical protein
MPINSYSPDLPPEEYDAGYLYEELLKLQGVLAFLLTNHQFKEYNAAPDKYWNGYVALADGANWNPGSGRGLYWYDEDTTSWKLLG